MARSHRKEQAARRVTVNAVGGLDHGADPVALAGGCTRTGEDKISGARILGAQSPKAHGQTKLMKEISTGRYGGGD